MKVFLFDKVSEGVPSFGALPREAWMALGILELVCTAGLIVPAALRWKPALTAVATEPLPTTPPPGTSSFRRWSGTSRSTPWTGAVAEEARIQSRMTSSARPRTYPPSSMTSASPSTCSALLRRFVRDRGRAAHGEQRRLIIYEGVTLRGTDVVRPGVVDELEAALQAGDVEGMLTAFLRELAGASPGEIELLRSQRDAWVVRLRNAPTIPRELKALERYTFAPESFRNLRTPTLLLVGGESPPHEMENARVVADALPDAQVVVLPGQQHLAMYTVPELFAREVVRFLEESEAV
jgi:pimeloyl-ACP methyl ester carboxylesterase